MPSTLRSKSQSASPDAEASTSVVPLALLEKIRADPSLVFPDASTVVLSSKELHRIRKSSVIVSDLDRVAQRQQADLSRTERQKRANERKERMLALEAARKSKAPTLSDIDLEEIRDRDALLGKAVAAADEQHEDVKRMTQMVTYAKCVAIRDKQIAEKQRMTKELAQQEHLLDTMMEFERQCDINSRQTVSKTRDIEQKQGAQVIKQQMRERELERVRAQETKMAEGIELLASAQQREIELEKEKAKKKEAGRALLDEIVAANQEQMREKARRKQEEVEEEKRIADYIKAREKREAERDEAQALIDGAKDRQKAKLCKAREKDNDHQAEIDALRWRRAYEETERRWRSTQKQSAEKAKREQQELAAARELQRIEKERCMGEKAREDKHQFERMVSKLREQETADHQREDIERKNRASYAKALDEQIQELESRKNNRFKIMDMSENTKHQNAIELRKLEAIKRAKLLELEKLGIPEKYRAELSRFKLMQPKKFA